jgi:hypothetical protein
MRSGLKIERYSSEIDELLATAPLNELGPGKPVVAERKRLENLSIETALAPHPVKDRTSAEACLAGLWLRFDFLDESHEISQSIRNATGSFWHGIMHRREPDYGNAKYWFHRVGPHPAFPTIQDAVREYALNDGAAEIKAEPAAAFLASSANWDPFKLVDLVESASRGRTKCAKLCREVQRIEWEALFDFCFAAAIGKSA